MFEAGEDPEVTTGLGIMNELVVPCIPLLLVQDAEKDLLAVEDMRNRWCSYLGQEMERESAQELPPTPKKMFSLGSYFSVPWKSRVLAGAQCEFAQRVTLGMSNILTPRLPKPKTFTNDRCI